jgi:HNH endonuclease
MLTQAELKRQLHYDPETGLFTWLISNKNNVKIGDTAGSYDMYGYLTIRIHYKSYKCHRLAWLYVYGVFPNVYLDHINRIKNDNRIINLRAVTAQQNQFNTKTRFDSTSGYTGVSFRKDRKKYTAYIHVNGRKKNLGCFKEAQDAHNAYLAAKSELHVI